MQADLPTPVPAQVGKPEAGDRDGDQQRQPQPQRRVVPDDHPVDDLPRDQRYQRLARAAEQRPGQREGHIAPVVEQVTSQPPDPSRRCGGSLARRRGWGSLRDARPAGLAC
jgi:hypothetical protein